LGYHYSSGFLATTAIATTTFSLLSLWGRIWIVDPETFSHLRYNVIYLSTLDFVDIIVVYNEFQTL
jgi:hypothetical protein